MTEPTPPSNRFAPSTPRHRCPTPTLRLQRALRESGWSAGRALRGRSDARIDVAHFRQQNGHDLVSLQVDDQVMVFRIRKAPRPPS